MKLEEKNSYDVVAIGNAILDVIAECDDAFIAQHGMVKGDMALISAEKAQALYDQMGQAVEASGGSAANTLAGMAQLGSKTAFIGKVHEDALGKIYRHDMRAAGVQFDTAATTEGAPTGCSYILVTPDAERTMNTYLGAGSEIYEEDIDEKLVSDAKIVYGEGYQWSSDNNKEALSKAFRLAHENGGKVAFALSAMFCVNAHREEFVKMVEGNTFDIVFANEEEAQALYPDLSMDQIMDKVQGTCDLFVITRGKQGSIILTPDERIEVPSVEGVKPVDSTGAGDLYAAGFLHALCDGKPLAECGALGSACAAHIIQQVGARSRHGLKDLQSAA